MSSSLAGEAYGAYVRKHERWNFWANVGDLTFYNFALSFIYGSTVLSLYVSHLTDAKALIGLIPAVQNVGYFLPQLIMARSSERLLRKKPMVVKFSIMERLPYLLIGLTILFLPGWPRWASYLVLALCLGVATLSGGLAGPAWNAMLAKVIRAEQRGFFFGLSHATGGLLGMAGAAISQFVLADERLGYPRSFGICFLFCFIFQVASWVCLTLNREPAQVPAAEESSVSDYWRRLPGVLRSNSNFARYLGGRGLLILGGMGAAFYIIYARHNFQISDAFGGSLTLAALASQTVCTPVLGWLSDRKGHKWLTELGALAAVGTVITVLLVPGQNWFYLVFVLMSASTSALMVGSMSLVMEFCPPGEVPTYVALANSTLAVPILAAPVLGGWLADTLGFRALFGVALLLLGGGWAIMRWGVNEPARKRNREPERVDVA